MNKDINKYFRTLNNNLNKNLELAEKLILREMHESSDRYVPEDTRATRNESRIEKNYVQWQNPYVERIFWGIDPRTR